MFSIIADLCETYFDFISICKRSKLQDKIVYATVNFVITLNQCPPIKSV